MRFVMLSDTHGHSVDIPEGDASLYAGDWSPGRGDLEDTHNFVEWIGSLPHKYKIVIPGNHDFAADKYDGITRQFFINNGIKYLINEPAQLLDTENERSIMIWGSPYHPKIWGKFELERGGELRANWSLIPEDTDVLITHGPPYGILDESKKDFAGSVGDDELNQYYLKHRIIDTRPPFLHVFGHIHEAYGQKKIRDTQFINASICDENYDPVNKPIVWTY